VVQVDPGPELVGEAEPVGVSQGGQIVEVIRGWRVVVRHPQIEGQLGQPAQRPDGIHDSEVTDASMRMSASPP
jgi:hypothetical protein